MEQNLLLDVALLEKKIGLIQDQMDNCRFEVTFCRFLEASKVIVSNVDLVKVKAFVQRSNDLQKRIVEGKHESEIRMIGMLGCNVSSQEPLGILAQNIADLKNEILLAGMMRHVVVFQNFVEWYAQRSLGKTLPLDFETSNMIIEKIPTDVTNALKLVRELNDLEPSVNKFIRELVDRVNKAKRGINFVKFRSDWLLMKFNLMSNIQALLTVEKYRASDEDLAIKEMLITCIDSILFDNRVAQIQKYDTKHDKECFRNALGYLELLAGRLQNSDLENRIRATATSYDIYSIEKIIDKYFEVIQKEWDS